MFIWRRVEQPGKVGRKPDLSDHNRMIGLGRQSLAQHSRCTRSRATRKQVVRIAETIAVFLIDQRQISALLDHAALAHDADRNIPAAVERIDGIDKRGGQLVIDADRDGEQPASAARLEGVNHPERQHVIAIAADIGVEDEPHRLAAASAAVARRFPQAQVTIDADDCQPDRRSRSGLQPDDASFSLTTRLESRDQSRSGDKLFDHPRRLDAGQALVEPLIAKREPLMVESQKPAARWRGSRGCARGP